MSDWKLTTIDEFLSFNPSEKLKKGQCAKKIPMAELGVFQRKINGFEIANYNSGPKFKNGDTLVAKITPCLENGKTAYVDLLGNEEVAFGSSEFIVLRANEYSDDKFIYYLARSPWFREKAISCMEGTSGRKRVNEGALKRQEVLVPKAKHHQKLIAATLSMLDDKIELNNQMNAELEAMTKTLYDYWFVQFEFPNENGKPYKSSGGKMVYNETLKRKIPVNWINGRLGNIAELVRGVSYIKSQIQNNYTNENIKILRATNVNGNIIDLNNPIIVPKVLVSTKQILNKYDILLTMSSGSIDHIGKNGFYYFDEVVSFGAFCAKLTTTENYRYLLYCFMQSSYLSSLIKNECLGTNINNLNSSMINDFKIVKPSNDILNRFNLLLAPIYKRIENNIKQNQELARLRDWLLPMLMNGQVKVS